MKRLLVIFFTLFAILLPAEQLRLPENTPVFRAPDPTTVPALILTEATDVEYKECTRFRYTMGPFLLDSPVYAMDVPRAGTLYAAPGFEYHKETGKIELRRDHSLCMQAILLLVGGLLLGVLFFVMRKNKYRDLVPVASIFFLSIAIMLFSYGMSGKLVMNLFDELQYYGIAKGILQGDFTGPWQYTIGLPLLYLPFLIFGGIGFILEYYYPYLIFSICFLTPFMLSMAYFIFRKLADSRTAFSAIMLWFVLTLFWQWSYQTQTGDVNDLNSFLIASHAGHCIFTPGAELYNLYTWYGCNAMSDTVFTTLLYFSLALMLLLKPSRLNICIIAAVYAFTCLIRLNSLLFAPALAFLYFNRYFEKEKWKDFLITTGCAAAVFLFVMMPQFILNAKQFGSPLTTPYVQHDAKNVGWTFSCIADNIPFLYTCSKAWFLPGFLSLLFVTDKRSRLLLSLWIYPNLCLFLAYIGTFNNANRFILPIYPALMFATAACPLFRCQTALRGLRLLAVMLSCIALTSTWIPEKWLHKTGPWGFTGDTAHWLNIAGLTLAGLLVLSFAIEYIILRKREQETRDVLRCFIFGLLFLLLWIEPTGYTLFAVSMGIFFYTLKDWKAVLPESPVTVK